MRSPIRLATAAAGVALLVTLFLPWFGGLIEESVRPEGVPKGRYTGVRSLVEDGSAWGYLSVTDILVALVAVAVVALALTARDRRLLLGGAVIALVAAGLIGFRVVKTPPPPFSVSALDIGVPPAEAAPGITTQRSGPERRYGIFLALAAAITAAGGCALVARQERSPDRG
jgi:hypothetical protein